MEWVQDNVSGSVAGVLRGMHVQSDMAKLVRCVWGSVLDVAVDCRPNSPTFRRHVAVTLSHSNLRALFVPPGFAHGFLCLSPTATLAYKCGAYHNPNLEFAINPFDPTLALPWNMPKDQVTMSDKVSFNNAYYKHNSSPIKFQDRNAPNLEEIPNLADRLKTLA